MEKEMRVSARLYPSSILVLFLHELLGPRFVAAGVRYHTDDSMEIVYYGKSGKVRRQDGVLVHR
jgi:hypothetical protein